LEVLLAQALILFLVPQYSEKTRQGATLFSGMDPRIVSAWHAWWFPERVDPEHGWDESNVNILTDNAYETCDPEMSVTSVGTLLCNISLEEGMNEDDCSSIFDRFFSAVPEFR